MKLQWFCILTWLILAFELDRKLSVSAAISFPTQSNYYMPTLPPRTGSAVTKRTFTCACDESSSPQPLCASNGITYKTECNFECAKKKVPRLRIVKSGTCGSLSKNDYWSGNKGSSRKL